MFCTPIADAERFAISDDEARCRSIQAECSRLEHECKEDFKQCEPILEDAERSLETLDKKNLTELKSLPSPPTGVDDVLIGVMILTAKGAIPKDLSWASAKKVMANVDQFIKMLQNLDKENIPDAAVGHCEKVLLTKDTFNPDRIRTKSTAASGLCSWVRWRHGQNNRWWKDLESRKNTFVQQGKEHQCCLVRQQGYRIHWRSTQYA
jgi:dynein heavy chain